MARVAIIGAGAMGSVYAGLMASAGHEVYAVTAWPDHAAAMQKNGLRVEGISGDRTVKVHASTTTDGIPVCDLVMITTKAPDVEAAAKSALPLLGPNTPVQAIQNGLGSAEKIASIVGADRTVVGIVGGFGASMRAPGHAHHNGMVIVHFGPYGKQAPKDMEASAEIWRSAGFDVELYEDTDRMVWEKLIMNVCFSGACTLTGMTIGQVLEDPDAWQVAKGCAEEAVAVGKAKGIKFGFSDPIAHIRSIGGQIPNARPSMLLDHMVRRRSEIHVINGSIPREGRKVGMPTPINDTVVALVKAREKDFTNTGTGL